VFLKLALLERMQETMIPSVRGSKRHQEQNMN